MISSRRAPFLPVVATVLLYSCSDASSASAPAPRAADDQVVPTSTLASHAEAERPTRREVSASDDDATSRFHGKYRHVGGERERQKIEDAIDDVVDDMNVLIRGIAKDRLMKSCTIPKTVRLSAEGDALTISFEDRAYTAVLGAPPVTVTGSSGDALALTHRLRGERIVQRFVGDRGGRTNSFSLKGDGKLKLRVTVSSEKLPEDVEYTLTFAR